MDTFDTLDEARAAHALSIMVYECPNGDTTAAVTEDDREELERRRAEFGGELFEAWFHAMDDSNAPLYAGPAWLSGTCQTRPLMQNLYRMDGTPAGTITDRSSA